MNIRRYATAPGQNSMGSTQSLVLVGLAGAMGVAAAYAFVLKQPSEVGKTPAAAQVQKPTVSAFDKDKFVDFKLKKIESYNHNTAK